MRKSRVFSEAKVSFPSAVLAMIPALRLCSGHISLPSPDSIIGCSFDSVLIAADVLADKGPRRHRVYVSVNSSVLSA